MYKQDLALNNLQRLICHKMYLINNAMAKVLNCSLKVSEFELQLCYYVHFQNNTLGKEDYYFMSF